MVNFFKTPRIGSDDDLPPTKRISTPAGQRLSVILENGNASSPRNSKRHSALKKAIITEPSSRESLENSSNAATTTSIWSDSSALNREKAGALGDKKETTKRGGWKCIGLFVAMVLVVIAAIIVGVVVGTQKKSSSSSNSSADGAASSDSSGSSASSPTATASSGPSSTLPADFPVGTYSYVTFLDTVTTDCTANPDTWSCYPYTIYNDDPQKAMSTFNWIIGSSSDSSFTISSTDSSFPLTFSNENLELMSEGEDDERYFFQFTMSKEVTPSSDITGDGVGATCYFNATTFQAYLYTKQVKTYPDDGVTSDASYDDWPFAIRVEQVASGGPNTPNCYRSDNGEQITDGLDQQDATKLCDCLYKNYVTPG